MDESAQVAGIADEVESVYTARLLGYLRNDFKADSKIRLPQIVLLCSGPQATMPHDYVYGFLGLMTIEERRRVKVDYEQSNWTVYRDITKFVIDADLRDKLHLFTQLKFDNSSEERPSLLLDLSSKKDMLVRSGLYLGSNRPSKTCEMARWSTDGEILLLRSVLLDTVDCVCNLPVEREDWWEHILDTARKSRLDVPELAHGPAHELLQASRRCHVSRVFLVRLDYDAFRWRLC
jgi:hypothetical protein